MGFSHLHIDESASPARSLGRTHAGAAWLSLISVVLAGVLAVALPFGVDRHHHTGAITRVQNETDEAATQPVLNPATTITLTLPANTTAGDLLVASMASNTWGTGTCWTADGHAEYSAPAEWQRVGSMVNSNEGLGTEIWYLPGFADAGGFKTVTFTFLCTGASNWALNGELIEFSGAAATPIDASNATQSGATASTTYAITATSTVNGDAAVSSFAALSAANGAVTFTSLSGWSQMGTDQANAINRAHAVQDATIAGSAGAQSDNEQNSQSVNWTASVALFKPVGGSLSLDTTSGFCTGTTTTTGYCTAAASQTVTMPAFTPVPGATGELIVVLVSHDYSGATGTTALSSTPAETWALVQRANGASNGDVTEIYSTLIPSGVTTPITISDTVATSFGAPDAQITVLGFTLSGATPATGASASAQGTTPSQSVGLTTTAPNSLIYGVGANNSFQNPRIPATGQVVMDQWISTGSDVYWVQNITAPVAAASTAVTLSDTSADGALDGWVYAGVEIVGTATNTPVQVLHMNRAFPTNGLNNSGTMIASPAVSTTVPNELLVATIAADGQNATESITGVTTLTGPTISWTFAVRTNAQFGDAEIWWAVVPQPSPNISFLAAQTNGGGPSLITIAGIIGADPATPITTPTSASGATGVQSISLTTTRDGSWMWAVGDDWSNSNPRTVTAGTLLTELTGPNTLGTNDGWTQVSMRAGVAAGSVVTMSDATLPDVWDYAAVEIKATAKTGVTLPQPTSSANATTNGSVTLSDTVTGGLGTPTGTLTFYDGDPTGLPGAATGIVTNLGTTAPLNGAGTASLAVTLAPGTHTITATYSGDATYASAVTTVLVEQVYSAAATSVLGWGADSATLNQLGDGGSTAACGCRPYPLAVKDLGGVTQISGTQDSSVALDNTGHVWAWGSNTKGQLGQGNTLSSATPVQVCAVGQSAPCTTGNGKALSNIVAVAAATNSAWALSTTGTLYGWGNNDNGDLCDGTASQRLSPVSTVVASGQGVFLTAGYKQVMVLTSSGAAYACGRDEGGSLGTGAGILNATYKTPTLLPYLPPVAGLAPGHNDGTALLYNHTVMTFGINNAGDIANGTTIEQDLPYQPSPTGVVAVTAGTDFSAIRYSNGTIAVAGDGTHGEIGNGSVASQTAYTPTVALAKPAINFRAGEFEILVQENDNSIWAFGDNGAGQLGNNNNPTDSNVPVAVHGFNNVGTLTASANAGLAGGLDTSFVINTAPSSTTVTSSLNPAPAGTSVTISATVDTGSTAASVVYGQGGNFTTGAANNGGVATGLNTPHRVAVDSGGNVYMADTMNNRVLYYAAGSTTPSAVYGQAGLFTCNVANNNGSCVSGTPSATGLNQPFGVALDGQRNLYVADQANNRVLFFPVGTGCTAANTPAGCGTATRVYGQVTNANFTCGVANNNGTCAAGTPTATTLNAPFGVTVDVNGNVYVADRLNNRVLEYPASGSVTPSAVFGQAGSFTSGGFGGTSATSLQHPVEIATDASANVYVVDQTDNRVVYYAAGTGCTAPGVPANCSTATRVYGQTTYTSNGVNSGGLSATSLNTPVGVATDANGGLYVGDWANNRLLFYPPGSTTATRVYGQAGVFTANSANYGGSITASTLNAPSGLAIDGGGGLYVTDENNNRMLYYSTPAAAVPAGTVTFYDGATVISGAVALSGGVATLTTSTLTVGSHGLSAVFAPSDQNYAASTSNVYPEIVYNATAGTAYGWGDNSQGQLGDGTTVGRAYRGAVSTLGATVTQIAANYYAAAAIDNGGNLWVWGYNNKGQAGTGANPTLTPFKIIGTGNVVAVAVGGSDNGSYGHMIALKSDGSVWTWGDNTYGEIGNGTSDTAVHSTPAQVPGISAVGVAANYFGDELLKADGTVVTWGGNGDGELGNATSCTATYGTGWCMGSSSPVQVGGLTNVTAISAEGEWVLALKSNGTAWAWGRNNEGQLGNAGAGVNCAYLSGPAPGYDTCETSPVQVGAFTDAVSIHAGKYDGYAINSGSLVRDWGGNFYGELGDGTSTKRASPVTMTDLSAASAVGGGYGLALALLPNGTIDSMGLNNHGQLGGGTTSDRATGQVSGLTNGIAVASGWYSGYAIATATAKVTPTVAVTSSVDPSVPGQSTTYTATVRGAGPTPTGPDTVTFNQGYVHALQSGSVVSNVGANTLTLAMASSTAGTTLVASLVVGNSASTFSGPAGWVQAATSPQAGAGRVDIWYYPNNPGGITTATFTTSGNGAGSYLGGQVSEWAGLIAAPLDITAASANSGVGLTSGTVASTGATAGSGDLAITSFVVAGSSQGTFSPGAGWTVQAASANVWGSDTIGALPIGHVRETETWSGTTTAFAGVIVTLKPAFTTLCAAVVLNASGQATCGPQTYTTTGAYTIIASFSGDATYNATTSDAIHSDFEDGGPDRWSTIGECCGLSVINSSAQAFSGTQSLALNVTAGSGTSSDACAGGAGDGVTACNASVHDMYPLDMGTLSAGDVIAYHIYVPAAGVTGGFKYRAYYQDTSTFANHYGPWTFPVTGWNTLTYTMPAITVGVNDIAVQFGDSSWSGTAYMDAVSQLAVQNVITATSTTVVSPSPTSMTFDGNVTFTATVTFSAAAPSPTGSVAFSYGATSLGSGTANGSGIATYTCTACNALPVGTDTITATYTDGTGLYPTSSGTTTVTVGGGVLSVSAPAPLTVSGAAPGVTTGPTAMGSLSFTNTLGDGGASGNTAWSVKLSSTDLCNGATVGMPFTLMTISVDPAPAGGAGAAGTLTPGSASQPLSGADTTPCSTQSNMITLATGASSTAGTWTMANSLTFTAKATAPAGTYTGTLTYTITG